MPPLNEQVTIYGLRDKGGQIVYIGRTTNPKMRAAYHKRACPDYTFVELEMCSRDAGESLELQYIRKYLAQGQARLNVRGATDQLANPRPVRFYQSTDDDLAQIAQDFNIPQQELIRRIVHAGLAALAEFDGDASWLFKLDNGAYREKLMSHLSLDPKPQAFTTWERRGRSSTPLTPA